MAEERQHGIVKLWNEKGFGFIKRPDFGDSIFCHSRETPDRAALVAGTKVSFLFESDDKGGKAKNVLIEEAVVEDDSAREMGTIKKWNAEKGFGFISRATGGDDAFVHKRDCGGKDLVLGQAVSFVFEEGPKGASAKNVREEEGGMVTEAAIEEDEGERELGKVKSYNEEKGFAFIGRCTGGDDVFGHKREFGGVEPYIGQPVSFIIENTEKGDTAKKIRVEESVPEPVLSDEGREFGTVKNFNVEKGFGFIVRKNGGDDAHVHVKQCNGLTLAKDMCVSFVCEDGEKGPAAKDLRQEDPARVARVTAKVLYGTIERYLDPPDSKPTSGYGFIVPLDTTTYGAPKRFYFHMSEIETPDEHGGIEPGTGVRFIVTPSRSGKGFQAVGVAVADPPNGNEKDDKSSIHASVDALKVDDAAAQGGGWGDGGNDAAQGGGWGTGGNDAAQGNDSWGNEGNDAAQGNDDSWGTGGENEGWVNVANDGWS